VVILGEKHHHYKARANRFSQKADGELPETASEKPWGTVMLITKELTIREATRL
jgi:hypothetical protein